MIHYQFNFLTPAELIILEEHLKLGIPHLKEHLSKREVERLLGSLSLSQLQISEIGRSNIEISGNLSLILNTVFTATFGAWLGYSAFWGLSLSSTWVFGFIVTIAASFGVLIGYQSVRFTKQQSMEAINAQRINFLQIEILKIIHEKRREEIDAIILQLDDLFANLSFGTFFKEKVSVLNLLGKSTNEISEWALKVEAIGRAKLDVCFNGLVSEECTEEWVKIQEELSQNAISFFEKKEELQVIHNGSQVNNEETIDSSLRKLISRAPKKSEKSLSWIRSNIRALVLGLAPTLLGGFSSLSVYLGGVPLILKNFGYDKSILFFANPKVKMVEFAISLLITLYFGFSFAYMNWNAFKRYREIKKTNQNIIQMESALTVLDVNMLALKELRSSAIQLMRFFKIVSKITEHFSLGVR